MSDSPKRTRLAVTYVAGQGCELDLAISDLTAHTGKPLKKGDIRELVILGSLAKRAGFTSAKELSGRHVLIPMTTAAAAMVVAGTHRASPEPGVTMAKADAANDSAQATGEQHPAHAPAERSHSTRSDRAPSPTVSSANAQPPQEKSRPVTVNPRPAKETDAKPVSGTPSPVVPSKVAISEGVNTVTVTESVTANDLTHATEESATPADTGVMTEEEGSRLLDMAFNFG